jgi:hypothetical protein
MYTDMVVVKEITRLFLDHFHSAANSRSFGISGLRPEISL